MQPVIELHNVSLRFPPGRSFWRQGYLALDDVSLSVERGDRLCVVGRNGAGKSTLLQILADVLVPDAGRVVRRHGPCQMLNLNLGFLPHLSGRENALMAGLLQGYSKAEAAARLDAIREFSELEEFFDEPFRTYSSGMRTRLGFAAALSFEPDVLLIDEVLAVGDAGFQEKSRRALAERIRSGITVVIVSHQEALLRSLCSHALWIEHGRTVMYGEVATVLDAYARAESVDATASGNAPRS